MTEDQRVAANLLTDTIQSKAEVIGPQMDDDYGPPPEAEDSADGWVVSDWVLVANWTSLRTGDIWTARIGSPDLPLTTRTGLLHEALFGME